MFQLQKYKPVSFSDNAQNEINKNKDMFSSDDATSDFASHIPRRIGDVVHDKKDHRHQLTNRFYSIPNKKLMTRSCAFISGQLTRSTSSKQVSNRNRQSDEQKVTSKMKALTQQREPISAKGPYSQAYHLKSTSLTVLKGTEDLKHCSLSAEKDEKKIDSSVFVSVKGKDGFQLPFLGSAKEESNFKGPLSHGKKCSFISSQKTSDEVFITSNPDLIKTVANHSHEEQILTMGTPNSASVELNSINQTSQIMNPPISPSDTTASAPNSISNQQSNRPFKSSVLFQTVLIDMYASNEYEKSRSFPKLNTCTGANIAIYASKFIGKVKARKNQKNSNDNLKDDSHGENSYRQKEENAENAKKGWGILKRHVQDMKTPINESTAFFNRIGIKKSFGGLANLEEIRQDLYERYGIVPVLRSDGTFVQENIMISEQARKSMAHYSEQSVVNSVRYRKF